MKDNEELRKTYNRIAGDWASDHKIDDWWEKGTDEFLKNLPKDSSILDLGCGSGYKTKYMKDRGYEIEGFDFSEEMINKSKERFPDTNFRVFDIYDLDDLDKVYDGIFCQAVLLHIPKKDIFSILEKIKRRIKQGGVLYVTVKGIRENDVEEEIVKENDYGYDYERFFSYYSLSELKDYFSKLNMNMIYEDIIDNGRSHWINIIVKK